MSSLGYKRREVLASIAATGLFATRSTALATSSEDSTTYHVKPEGSDDNPGTESEPFASIDTGVDSATPGDTVYVHPGEYFEHVDFSADGEPDAPITLTGPSEAVLKPPTDVGYQAISIAASHVHIDGLTVTGLYDQDNPDDPDSYHSGKLIDLNPFAEDDQDYLEGLVISPNRIGGAGQSLINSKLIKNSEIGGFKVIGPAGATWSLDDSPGHNGEIVYLGTAPSNIEKRDNFDEYDQTRNVRVHHVDNSEGHPHSELVDCKVGTRNITIEYCTDGGGAQNDVGGNQPAIRLDGHRCTVRWCRITGSEGAPVSIGPQTLLGKTDLWLPERETEFELKMGTEHSVYGNVFSDYGTAAVDYLRDRVRPERETNPLPEDQEFVCGNEFETNREGNPGSTCSDDVPRGNGVGYLGGESPWTRFTVSPTEPTANESVTFAVSKRPTPDEASYEWDVDGDGEFESTQSRVEHSFTGSGEYTVTLRTTTDSGASYTTTQTVNVRKQSPDAVDSVAGLEGSDGNMSTADLRRGISMWVDGDLSTSVLREAITAWVHG